jgi:hypothetical protein
VLLGMCKADLVLVEVGLCLYRIELDAHSLIVHTSCILATMARATRLLGRLTFELSQPQRHSAWAARRMIDNSASRPRRYAAAGRLERGVTSGRKVWVDKVTLRA